MGKRTTHEDLENEPRRPGFIRRMYHAFTTILIVGVIIYVVLLIVVRTDGFRNILEGVFEKHLGLPVKIESTKADFDFDLTIRDFETEDFGKGPAGIRANKIELSSWSWGGWIRGQGVMPQIISVYDAELVFTRSSKSSWKPSVLAPLSDWIGKWLEIDVEDHIREPSGVPAARLDTDVVERERVSWRDIRISLKNVNMAWKVDGEKQASVSGLSLEAVPIPVPSRFMKYYALNVALAESSQGVVWQNLVLEVLDAGDQQLIMVCNGERGRRGSDTILQ